jgi:hypothetical protein
MDLRSRYAPACDRGGSGGLGRAGALRVD